MSNSTVALRMLEVVSAYERGDVELIAIVDSVELHEPALEAVSRDVRDRLHKLTVQMLQQDLTELEEEQLGLTSSDDALKELKVLLQKIESGN